MSRNYIWNPAVEYTAEKTDRTTVPKDIDEPGLESMITLARLENELTRFEGGITDYYLPTQSTVLTYTAISSSDPDQTYDYEIDWTQRYMAVIDYPGRKLFEPYVFSPVKISITKVPQYVLGPGVLGRTWIGTGQVEILNTLFGTAEEEVALHEVKHVIYPDNSEGVIRDKTAAGLWFPPHFH